MTSYPIVLTHLDLAVVIGGGSVAQRKVEGLLEAGAGVLVISPELTPGLEALAAGDRVRVTRRAYRAGDLAGAGVAIAATGDREVNEAVFGEARERGVPVNVVDDPAHCTFHVPAVIRRGPVTVAISTGGASPHLAARLRREVASIVGPEYGVLARILGEWRGWILRHVPAEAREAMWDGLAGAMLPLLREGREAEARRAGRELAARGRGGAAAGELAGDRR